MNRFDYEPQLELKTINTGKTVVAVNGIAKQFRQWTNANKEVLRWRKQGYAVEIYQSPLSRSFFVAIV